MSLGSGGRRWQPAPAVRGAIALHAVAAGAVLFAPASWPWAVGAIAANHAVFFGASFLPRTRLIGANHSRLPASAIRRAEIALTFDDGPDPAVTPRLLDLLDAARAKATFFCVGEQVHRHPEIARAIVQRGHDLENHTQRHPQSFGFYGLSRCRAEIAAAQGEIERITGIRPRFFRAPFGVRNPFLDPVLHDLDLQYVSWTRRGFDTIEPDPEKVTARLTRHLAAGDILVLHDGRAQQRGLASPNRRADTLAVTARLLDVIASARLRAVTLRGAFA